LSAATGKARRGGETSNLGTRSPRLRVLVASLPRRNGGMDESTQTRGPFGTPNHLTGSPEQSEHVAVVLDANLAPLRFVWQKVRDSLQVLP
jgi:hypothetical protein